MTTRIDLFSIFIDKRQNDKTMRANDVMFERLLPYQRGSLQRFSIDNQFRSEVFNVEADYLIPAYYFTEENGSLAYDLRRKLAKALVVVHYGEGDFLFDLYNCEINNYREQDNGMLYIEVTCLIGQNRITKYDPDTYQFKDDFKQIVRDKLGSLRW